MSRPAPVLPEMRMNNAPLPIFYVVTPAGDIKGVRYERNLTSPIVTQEWREEQGRRVQLRAVGISRQFQALGWAALDDLYDAEDRAEDFDTFLLWAEKANKGTYRMPQISDDYLPDEVLRRRREWMREQTRIDLPLPKRKRKEAEKPAEKTDDKKGGK